MRNSHAKIYTVKLDAGKSYRIDMTSTEIDSFLRVEDSDGTRLGMDDDGAGFPNAGSSSRPRRTTATRSSPPPSARRWAGSRQPGPSR